MSSTPKEEIKEAVRAGDTTRLATLADAANPAKNQEPASPTLLLNEVAIQAVWEKQPSVLEWCYSRGWQHPDPAAARASLFHWSLCERPSAPVLGVLAGRGFELNGYDHGDRFAWSGPLERAVVTGDVDVVRFLLLEYGRGGEDEERRNKYEICPVAGLGQKATLVYPALARSGSDDIDEKKKGDSLEILRLLLDHGGLQSPKGYGAAIAAAETGNIPALELLLDRGVDTEEVVRWWGSGGGGRDPITGGRGRTEGTALYRACAGRQPRAVEVLLARGADARATNREGETCLSAARRGLPEDGAMEIVAMLKDYGAIEER